MCSCTWLVMHTCTWFICLCTECLTYAYCSWHCMDVIVRLHIIHVFMHAIMHEQQLYIYFQMQATIWYTNTANSIIQCKLSKSSYTAAGIIIMFAMRWDRMVMSEDLHTHTLTHNYGKVRMVDVMVSIICSLHSHKVHMLATFTCMGMCT